MVLLSLYQKSVIFNKRICHWINHNILYNTNDRNTKFHRSFAWLMVLLFHSLVKSVIIMRRQQGLYTMSCVHFPPGPLCFRVGIESPRLLKKWPNSWRVCGWECTPSNQFPNSSHIRSIVFISGLYSSWSSPVRYSWTMHSPCGAALSSTNTKLLAKWLCICGTKSDMVLVDYLSYSVPPIITFYWCYQTVTFKGHPIFHYLSQIWYWLVM